MFVAIGLGANLGRPRDAFALALARLSRVLTRIRVSPLYRTGPEGGPPQPDYVNAVADGWTRLPARELLAFLHSVEREAGRVRRAGLRNAPRPLDLDLLLYGAERIAEPALTVPHPRLAGRRFVLRPLADLVPRRVVPGFGRTVGRLLAEAPPARVEPAGSLFGRD